MLKVSQTKVKITPEGRFFPCGMPNGNWCEELADNQYASILLVELDNERLLWITLDAIETSEEYSTKVRNTLSEKFMIPFLHINLGYTHSHSAPLFGGSKGFMKAASEEYCNFVVDKIIDGTGRCFKQGLEEVQCYVKTTDASGYYSNRNGLDKLGDTEIKILEFRNQRNDVKGLALCYACHATVVNFQNTRAITSDIAGYLSRGLEAKTGVYPVVMLGAAGDMSNRCCRQGNTYDELVRVGDGLLQRIDEIKTEEEINIHSFSIEEYQYKETFVTTKEERQNQIKSIKEKIENAQTLDLKRVFDSALTKALVDKDGGEFVLNIKGTILSMGDLKICTMPAELFSCFGLQIKEAMNVKCPVFWGYSNYSVGYLYNKEEAGKSFESAATDIPVGLPEKITSTICDRFK